MSVREASCSCGQLRLVVDGDPLRVSVCHCLACQRRTGAPFGAQARFDRAAVRTTGRASTWTREADEDGETRVQRFCPECGATVWYTYGGADDVVAVPVGALADPGFPAPTREVWTSRRHAWVTVTA